MSAYPNNCNYAKCAICGGTIRMWHNAPGRWFHETINDDNEPFDIIDWWANPEKRHDGQPVTG